nr:conserved hypothetical protein [Halimeda borneensis]
MNIQKNFINCCSAKPRHLSIKFYIKKNISLPSPFPDLSLRDPKWRSDRSPSGGMALIRTKPIILKRPLIQLSRFECFKFCEFWNLPIYPDITNLSFNSCRNRLRLQLIPYLKYFFNLNLNQRIKIFQELINIENQYFKSIIQKLIFTESKNFPKIFKYQIFHTFLQHFRSYH